MQHLYISISVTTNLQSHTTKMVKLEEVPDEEYTRQQEGPNEGDDDWDTDSGKL